MGKKKILVVFGTRPEAIKMSPLVKELKKNKDYFDVLVCVTGQHREMLDQVLYLFDIKPDYDLNIMKPGQDLYDITSRILIDMRTVLKDILPDIVLVHGDTSTCMTVSLAAFYQQIPVGHIEAGLRTYNIYSPWPEEINRQITSRIAKYNFVPTLLAKEHLLSEGIDEASIYLTGNTVIDALKLMIEKIKSDPILISHIKEKINTLGYNVGRIKNGRRMVLITGHRRENFGDGFLNICKAIKQLSYKYQDVDFVYPMHLNPKVRNPIHTVFDEQLSNLGNTFFIEPLEYLYFVFMMEKSYLVLTDSGGIQEEAPGLGKPVLVMRDTTERPEAVEAGTVLLVGAETRKIIDSVSLLLDNEMEYMKMSKAINPYGDGTACKKISEVLKNLLND